MNTPLKCLTFIKPPSDFSPKVEVSGCFCEYEDKLLFLERHPNSPQGGTWGIPSGKHEIGEDALAAVIREVYEETGLIISKDSIDDVGKLYVRHPTIDFIYHMFRYRFHTFPQVTLRLEEHLKLLWVTVDEALRLPLIAGGADAIKCYLDFINSRSDA